MVSHRTTRVRMDKHAVTSRVSILYVATRKRIAIRERSAVHGEPAEERARLVGRECVHFKLCNGVRT